jgi:hypothetical protein
VASRGATRRTGLIRIADDRKRLAGLCGDLDEIVLCRIGVLKLVDEDVLDVRHDPRELLNEVESIECEVSSRQGATDVGDLPSKQKIVKIESIVLLQFHFVLPEIMQDQLPLRLPFAQTHS